MNDEHEWGTSTLGLAAAAISLGAKYSRADKSDKRRIIFYLTVPEDKTGLDRYFGKYRFNFEEVETAWMNRTLEVNAYEIVNALQDLKSVIHSGRL